MTKSIPSILFATLFATTLGFAQDTESLLDLARGEAAKEGSTPALVAAATKARAIESGLSEDDANYEASRAVARAIAEKEYEVGNDAANAGQQGVIAGTILYQGKSYSEVPVDSMGHAIAEGITEKALAKGKHPADVAGDAKSAALSAGVNEDHAKDMAANIASREVVYKALANGGSASVAALNARQAAVGAGLDVTTATLLAADVATDEVTERSLENGETFAETATKAREAAEGAGLDAETAKDRVADVMAEKVVLKAISDGKSATEVGTEALAAAKAAGVTDEEAKIKAGTISSYLLVDEAIAKGVDEEAAKLEAKAAAEATGFTATDAEALAITSVSDVKEEFRSAEGNRTPVVQNVLAAQIEGTKLLRITYDLKVTDNFPCSVTIRWSTDNGASFPLTATAVTGAVGPGVMQGNDLEVIWDMAVDWDNKFTDQGQVEVIASRIPAEGGKGHDTILAPTASWSLANNSMDLVITTSSLQAEELARISTAIDEGTLYWVDTLYPTGENGDERAIWHDTDEANHSLQIAGNILTLTVKHTSALDAPNFNLLDVTGIDTDSVDVVSDPITLADLPAAGTQTLRMIFALPFDNADPIETLDSNNP